MWSQFLTTIGKVEKKSNSSRCNQTSIQFTSLPGETWGLYFGDYEEELREIIEENTERFIKKHPEDKWRPWSKDVKILECPLPVKEATPQPPPPPPKPRVLPTLNIREPLEAETMPELTVAIVGVLPCFDMRDYDNPNKYRWRSPLCLLSPHILVTGIFTRRA